MSKIIKKILRKIYNFFFNIPLIKLVVAKAELVLHDIISRKYLKNNFENVEHNNFSSNKQLENKDILDLVTVAFNNEQVVQLQIQMIKKNFIDPYFLTIADNSTDLNKRKLIKKICDEEKVGYIGLSSNPFSGRFGNWSHGLALNWLYRNYIVPRNAQYFGFLDHDIFPINKTSVLEFLKAYQFGGVKQEVNGIWYLWPGCCFYRAALLKRKSINFSSSTIFHGLSYTKVDTGGGNWKNLYSKVDQKDCFFYHHTIAFLNDGAESLEEMFKEKQEITEALEKHGVTNLGTSDKVVEFFGSWLHLRRISYGNKQESQNKLNKIINFYLRLG